MVQINNEGIQFHTKNDDPKADKEARQSNLDAAAKALIINFEGHKGNGDKAYIEVDGKKLKISDVSLWMDKLDTNKDGKITTEELKKGGGDKYNILQLQSDEKTQQKISSAIEDEQKVNGMVGLGKGLNVPSMAWGLAKSIIMKNTTKDNLKDMFQNKKVNEYYNKNLWGTTPEEIKSNESARKHMREIFQQHKFTEKDLKEMNFTDEQIRFFLEK